MRADQTVASAKPLARHSLRWRLPLLIETLIILVLVAFLGVAYREVKGNLWQSAATRAQAMADQLAGLLTQSVQQRLTEFRRVARQPAVRRLLRHPSDVAREEGQVSLATLTGNGPQRIDVWDTAGQCVVSLSLPPTASDLLPPSSAPSTSGVASLQRSHDVVFSESVVDILPEPAPDGRAATSQDRLGFLVVRRTITAAPTADVLNRLVGKGATIGVGNKTGDVWTDLTHAIEAPSINLGRLGLAEYSGSDGQRHLGSLADIRGTPWAVWVEFPHGVIFAPARAFLQRMVLMALGFVLVSGMVIAVVAARITTPLYELTKASEAIAGGEYSRRVAIRRRDEIGRLSVTFNAMAEQVESAQRGLEARVRERTANLEQAGQLLEQHVTELAAVNRELEAFSYSVSHDLRAPLRHITGFAKLLEQSESSSLGTEGRRYLTTMTEAATRMGRLVDDLLSFSRVGRTPLARAPVNLNHLVRDVHQEVTADLNGREVAWRFHDLPAVEGDRSMLRLVLLNLLSNAVKYSAGRPRAEIEIGTLPNGGAETVVFVRDNGAGFDMQYADKLFGVFQRLHSSDEFEGTGIGLANVRRIVQRHGGRTWADGRVDGGATFYFSLPNERTAAQ
jgi:signal transduction histidine kinase